MSHEIMVERLFEYLINGDRPGARALLAESISKGASANSLLTDLFWPAHEHIEKLFKSDQMTTLSYQLSTRLLRMLVDQTAGRLQFAPARNETIFAACGPSQGEELAGQMACDLLESAGFDVTFTGGGIPADEILAQVQQRQPTYLVLFASAASDLPGIRQILDTLKEIGACKQTKVVVGGGVFNRADGLAEEIGATMWTYSPLDLVDLLTLPPEADQPAARTTAFQPVQGLSRSTAKRKTRAAA